MIENRTILQGDVMEQLKLIPDNFFDCKVSSPPYFKLRDYRYEGQWGSENSMSEYLEKMRLFMAEIKRVTKPTATIWVNLGDSYSGGATHSDFSGVDADFDCKRMQEGKFYSGPKPTDEVAPKSRYGVPERFYINCIDDGFLARNHIVWHKPNPMPQSVTDRFSNVWESLFFFAKQKKYYFNLTAVRVPAETTQALIGKKRKTKKDHKFIPLVDIPEIPDSEFKDHTKDALHNPHDNTARLHRNRIEARKQDNTLGSDGKPKANYKGFNDRFREKIDSLKAVQEGIDEEIFNAIINEGGPEANARIQSRIKRLRELGMDHDACINHPMGKNPGDIFKINVKPFREAHFATFPIDLPLTILKAGCPNQVCVKCGEPRYPIVEPTEEYKRFLGKGWHDHSDDKEQGMQQEHEIPTVSAEYVITGWTKCDCNDEFRPGRVLDPFFGAGTTAVAAEMLGLDWVGIEKSTEYIKIAERRLSHYKLQRLV